MASDEPGGVKNLSKIQMESSPLNLSERTGGWRSAGSVPAFVAETLDRRSIVTVVDDVIVHRNAIHSAQRRETIGGHFDRAGPGSGRRLLADQVAQKPSVSPWTRSAAACRSQVAGSAIIAHHQATAADITDIPASLFHVD